jgi:M6 family metalloprotease-like protein
MFRTSIWLFSLAATLSAQAVLTPHPCTEADTLRSATGLSTATQIQFRNDTPGAVKVFWIDTTGRKTLYSTLPPGAGFTQSTFSGHVWLVTDGADACVALFVATADAVSVAKVGSGNSVSNPCVLRPAAQFTMGPTDYTDRPRSEGNLKALLMFVDFSDAPGTESTAALYNALAPPFERWYAANSRGKVAIPVTPVNKWYRMPKPASTYSFARGLTFDLHKTYITDALKAGDAEIDYTQYDIYYIQSSNTPNISFSPTWIPRPGSGVTFDGKEIRHVVTLGADTRFNSPNYGAWIMMHETGHIFGLLDLYDFGTSVFPNFHRFVGGWDPMGWLQFGSSFSSWEQWKLQWLDDTEMNCVGNGDVEETLTSLTTGAGARGVSVPVSPTRALVAELRDKSGVDANLCDTGVLLYSVDSSIATGQGPMRVINGGGTSTSGACGILADATFRPDPGKRASYTEPATGVSFTITGTTVGSYKISVHNPVAVPGAPELLSPVRVSVTDTTPSSLPIGSAGDTPFTVTADSRWIQVTPPEASAPATLTVSTDGSLDPGTYHGILNLKSANGVRRIAVDAVIGPPAVEP